MIEGLDRLESLFGKRFTVSFGLPVLFFYALNLVLYEQFRANLFGADTFSLILWFGQLEETSQLGVTLLALVSLYLVSIVLSLIVPVLREIFEGKIGLPPFLSRCMRLRQRDEFWRLERRLERLEILRKRLPEEAALIAELDIAQNAGESPEREQVFQLDRRTSERQARRMLKLAYREMDDLWGLADLTMLKKDYFEKLSVILADAVEASALPYEIKAGNLRNDIHNTIDHLRARFEEEQATTYTRLVEEMPKHRLSPTAIGNIAEAWRSQTHTIYNMDADYFWSRLEPLIPEDAPLKTEIQDAKSRLDAMVVMTFFSLLFMLFWLPVSGALGSSVSLFVSVALLSPLAIGFFLFLSKQSYLLLGKKLRSAVDIHRFKIFEALHQALPRNLNQERQMWGELLETLSFAEFTNLRYKQED